MAADYSLMYYPLTPEEYFKKQREKRMAEKPLTEAELEAWRRDLRSREAGLVGNWINSGKLPASSCVQLSAIRDNLLRVN